MTFLYLKPVSWRQSIRRYPSIDVNGLYLTAQCTTTSDLLLGDKLKLSDLEISLSFLRGAVPEKDQEKVNLAEGAIGGIWWLSDHNFVHGSIYLPDEDYAALWDQIKGDDYIDCDISLGTMSESVDYIGGEFAWKGNPISVDRAEVYFKRKANKQDVKEDSKAKPTVVRPGNNRWWAILLILIAVSSLPQWNGFFSAWKNLTAGEATTVSTILFVGGLLLWFMRR
jgi:hypothetical protein